MYLVRPVDFSDLPALERLAQQAGIGFTNFPANRDRLNDRIASSKRSMLANIDQPGEESYSFVLIDTSRDAIVGACGIEAMVGTDTPFYSYRIDEVVHASPQMQIHNRISALFLCHDYNGTSRMMALVVDQAHQNHIAMSLLSRARLLFMARHKERFTKRIFVELRGESDRHGFSPFWDSLGKHFFSMDFQKADYLSGVSNKNFIADLMPRYPIYVPTLPKEAQDVIGVVHEESGNSADILLEEGFQFRNYIDIFDAGPTVESRLQDIHTVANSKNGTTTIEEGLTNAPMHLIATGRLGDFRATVAPAYENHYQLTIETATRQRLQLHEGEETQWISL
ncbi:arginine N-succinyltransferase [Marinomonas sp. 15G1-11]|uniref:Arginine N-succinyltransferase n=1 Tax=Marinomonas phaeophyticola TaxID=3004091 RepID=A0ABT4JSW6_9GAMM|nr:arginine N-succinyltransferase [Marinomonas sp. 15G1-11]MCZ2721430.1 arginine N-succinyltransferase [Marinomonas sp. 15G1-11]